MTIDWRKNLQRVECNRRPIGLAAALLTATLLEATILNSQASAQTQFPDSRPAIVGAVEPAAEMDKTLYRQTVSRGVTYLLEKGQDAQDGSFSKQLGPAVTAMCVSALLKNGVPVSHEKVQKSLKFLESFVRPNGGIYAPKSNLRNYETSVALMCLHQANTDGQYDLTIEKAIAFLKGIQWDEGESHQSSSRHYGGQGYGKHKRPDASNTSFFLDALKETQPEGNSEAIRKAVVFMSRCQNLPSEYNDAEFALVASDDDLGGMIYSAVGTGESKAENKSDTPIGGLRSYASMTYAGLKSFLYAGLDKEDLRVKAALDWISRHYDLTSNPGVGQQGLFYYYHVFAKALHAYGQQSIVDSNGIPHNWRADLLEQLSNKQGDDGSWTNPADRWYEGDPNLVTSYSLLALSYLGQESE